MTRKIKINDLPLVSELPPSNEMMLPIYKEGRGVIKATTLKSIIDMIITEVTLNGGIEVRVNKDQISVSFHKVTEVTNE